MLHAVDFISKKAFTDVKPASDLAVISIGDAGESVPNTLRLHDRRLRLEIFDIELEDLARHNIPADRLCRLSVVETCIAFIRALHDEPALFRLAIHCHWGASRSAAVALVANHITQCSFPRQAEANYANRHVILLAEEVLGCAIAIPPCPGNYDYLPSRLVI